MERPFPDRSTTAEELRAILADPADPRRLDCLAKVLREMRPDQVWEWTTPQAVAAELPRLRLGRKQAFWHWLFDGWRRLGYPV